MILGFILSWPAAAFIAHYIKLKDPGWNEARGRPVTSELHRRDRRPHGPSSPGAHSAGNGH